MLILGAQQQSTKKKKKHHSKVTKLYGETGEPTFIVGDFGPPPSEMDRCGGQKTSKDTVGLPGGGRDITLIYINQPRKNNPVLATK